MGLTNNDIMKKLRVAHKLRDEDIVKICELVDFQISKSELGAIYRNQDHPKYIECGDQFLRNFLNGLIIHLRGPMPPKAEKKAKSDMRPKPERRDRTEAKAKTKPKPRIRKKE